MANEERRRLLDEAARLRRQLADERERSSLLLAEVKRLRVDSAFVENLARIAQVIILVLDYRGNILYFNPFMEKVSGYALAEVRGKAWFDVFLPAKDRERIRLLFSVAIQGEPTQGNVNPIVMRDGSELIVEWYDATIKDDTGKVIELLSVGVDVTKRVSAERERDELRQRLERSLTKVLSGFIPICAKCKKIRGEDERWERLEAYLSKRTEAEFSHSICPLCAKELYPDIDLS